MRSHSTVAQLVTIDRTKLYDNSIKEKISLNRALEKIDRLEYELKLMHKKLRVKESLVDDSLACTFVACPCHENHKTHNSQIIFTLRKKVMQLRDLRAIQELEIINLRKSLKFIQVSSLMDEI